LIWALLIFAVADLALASLTLRHRTWSARHWRVLGALLAALAAATLALGGAFRWLALSLEHDVGSLWVACGVVVAVVAYSASRRLGRIPGMELGWALWIAFQLAVVIALASGASGLASPPFRALLVAPAALPLTAYFGASVGYLAGTGAGSLLPGYETFVGRRFLLSKSSPVISVVTTISVLGVALGVALVIVALAILSGFENDLEQKIIAATGHMTVEAEGGRPFVLSEAQLAGVRGLRGVVADSPVVEGEAAVSSNSNYAGVLVFGIDPAAASKVLTVLDKVTDGSLAPLSAELEPPAPAPADAGEFPPPAPLPRVVIGVELAKGLNVSVGDKVRIISPILETMTPLGPAPKSAGFEVAGIFSSKMYEYDARYVFVSLPAARRFFELAQGEITQLQLAARDADRTDYIAREAEAKLGPGFSAQDWKSRNLTLFSALKLERLVAFVVLVFIILVASFAIVNTLSMSVIEKKKEIAILKTMGARDGGIMKLFLTQGLVVGAFGMLLGLGLALSIVGALQRFGFAIPGDVYYIDSLPVHLQGLDVVGVLVAAVLIVWDFSVFPALRGSRLSPVEGLRDA
jgi:lipoprotein-releasing system permease protein